MLIMSKLLLTHVYIRDVRRLSISLEPAIHRYHIVKTSSIEQLIGTINWTNLNAVHVKWELVGTNHFINTINILLLLL